MPQNSQVADSPHRILVVDDDTVSCLFLRMALEKSGYLVETVNGVAAAQAQLDTQGFEAFDCVVADYQMPDQTGVDLLVWLRDREACLATVMLTGHEEKRTIADALRGGAVDFLEKPVHIPTLRKSIAKAVVLTQQQRHAASVRSAVAELGRTQAWMLQSKTTGVPVHMDICFHPKLAAGGDFFSHFQPAPGRFCCLLTDVSGHDLQAAYLSAYFQGLVRGMLRRDVSMPEVFAYFNGLLLDEWGGTSPFGASISVAACGLLFDFENKVAYVINCGTPPPLYISTDGRAEILKDLGGYPLGWFPEFDASARIHGTTPGGAFLLWTDGLEDLAKKNGVSQLSAGLALQLARRRSSAPIDLAAAPDDILFAEVRLPSGEAEMAIWHPLLVAEYHGGQGQEIDQFQSDWSRSLLFALPEIGDRRHHDVLLATRESVLNALEHGCQENPECKCRLQISYCIASATIRVWVEDPGPGHDFSRDAHEASNDQELHENHRGLIFLKYLTSRLQFERRGATVIMDFGPENRL